MRSSQLSYTPLTRRLADLADGFGNHSGSLSNAFDLLDDKPLNLAGGNRWRGAF